jgi:rod shape-determining protein MreC
LEIISLGLLSTSYSYQRSLSYSLTNDISGSLLKAYSDLGDYFYLKEENEQLLEDNANLRNQLAGSFLATDTSIIYFDTLYSFLPTRIISSTNNMQMNRIIIDKGKLHGVKKEMGVVGKDGIVGIVIGVSDHYSTVMSALSRNANFSAMIKQSGQLVNVSWPGNNYSYGEINDIPSHIQLLEGDTIISSGNSIIFPKGILIGFVVEHKKREDKDLSKAKIRFSVDFNKLHHAYVVKNLMKPELDSLIKQTNNE